MLRPSSVALHGGCKESMKAARHLARFVWPLAGLIGLTLLSAPFVAGNDAGRAFNTWPKMNYDWVPAEWIEAVSAPVKKWRAFFEDTAVVQFDHRMLAYASLGSALGIYAYSTTLPLAPAVASVFTLMPVAVAAQLTLGIVTLLHYVPIELGVAHQAGGVGVLSATLLLLHTLRTPAVAVAAASPAAVAAPLAAAAAVGAAAAAATTASAAAA